METTFEEQRETTRMEIDNNLSCNKCIYCIKKNEKI